jgi:dihydroorotase
LKILLRGGRVIDPASKRDETTDVLIDGGKIVAIDRKIREGAAEDATTLNAEGLVVAPGLVDMHVHFREPGQEYKEDITSGSRAAAAGGVTSVACMPNTDPPLDNDALIAQVVKRGIEVGLCRVHPIAAITRGIEGRDITEMMLMRQAGAVGFSDDGRPVVDARVMRRALEYARLTDVPVISHCEETSLSQGGHMHEGAVSTRLGIKGIPAASEDIGVARDVRLAEITGGRLHVCHVSTARSVEVIREAKARGVRVTAEATPHHFTLTDEACEGFDANTKMNPPLRSEEDRAAVIQGLIDGTLDAIATDHAPHAEREKLVEFDRAPFGIIGLETSLALAITSLVVPGHLDLPALVRLMSTAPATILGLEAGTLKKGAPADIVVFDPNTSWTFEREDIRSKSQNTPFLGYSLTGRVLLTIREGKIVHERKEGRARIGTGRRSKVEEGEPLGSARS